MIDISIYVALVVFSLSLGIVSMLGSRLLPWGTFAMMGATIAAFTALAVGQDGTISSSGTALVSAGTLIWNAIILTPIFLAGIDLMLGIVAILKSLGIRT